MAVTKIRKISSWILIVVAAISVALFGLFYFGGVGAPLGEFKNPIYTGHVLIWSYILLGICAVSMLLFGLFQFGSKFKSSPKNALTSLAVFVVFAILLVIAYSVGSGEKLVGLNADSQTYNIPFWLKITDMWLYAMYILLGLAIVAMIWGSIKKILSK